MDSEKLNEAIHKYLDYCVHDWSGVEVFTDVTGERHKLPVCIHCNDYEASQTEWKMPSWDSSHFEVREFLAELERKGLHWEEYLDVPAGIEGLALIRYAIMLTPEDLAIAGAKAAGIWEEDQ